MPNAPILDLAAVPARQQATRASGEHADIVTLGASVAECLIDTARLRGGSR